MQYLLGIAAAMRCALSLLRGQPGKLLALTEQAEALTRQLARRPLTEILHWRGRGQQASGGLEPARATLLRGQADAERIGHQRVSRRSRALQAAPPAEAGDAAHAEALLAQARAIILSIADHTGLTQARTSFLARPAARTVILGA